MDSFLKMFNLQMVLLSYIVIGILCRKKQIITIHNQQNFINIVLDILMPCMVFHSFRNITFSILENAVYVLFISFGICMIAWVLGHVLYYNYPDDKRNVLRYATLINNAGFAGLPLAQGAFGEVGLIYASVFLIPIRIFMWSAGVMILSKEHTTPKELIIKLLKNPNILAVIFGLLRGLCQIPFPSFLDGSIEKLAACVSPLSMIIIGAIIADVALKSLFDKGVLFYTMIRLLLMPLLVFLITFLLDFDSTMIGVSMILTAMPAATSTALLAGKHHANVEFASKLILVSTILSLITTPFLMLLL